MKKYYREEFRTAVRIAFIPVIIIVTLRFSMPVSSFLSSLAVDVLSVFFSVSSVEAQVSSVDKVTKAQVAADRLLQIKAEETKPLTGGYETPQDVLDFESEYLAAFASSAPSGSTTEVFFNTSGATDTVLGVSVKNTTSTKKPDFEALINEGISLEIPDKKKPVVLIFHTHTTESYLLSDNGSFYSDYQTRSTDSSKNMVRVGDEICRALEESGIGFIHDTAVYDEAYEGAYARSRESVIKYLEKYPSIQIVLDVHRDAIYYSDTERCKPTAVIDGRKAAQIMIITGAQEGYITDFPDWEENLRFALSFQKTAQESFQGLMKPLYFCQRKYNMDLGKISLLFEMGTDANTLDEAMYSGYLAGKVLAQMINTAVSEN